jgi:hypothetical protein
MTMSAPVSVRVSRVDDDLEADLEKVRRLAKLLDAQFEIGGVKYGWDAIVGLVPVVGDLVMALVGVYPIIIARKHKVGRVVQTRMAMNLLLDWAVGEIPLLGDAFDVAFKANLKNAKLLESAVKKRRSSRQ